MYSDNCQASSSRALPPALERSADADMRRAGLRLPAKWCVSAFRGLPINVAHAPSRSAGIVKKQG
jgi:hypothetical protein